MTEKEFEELLKAVQNEEHKVIVKEQPQNARKLLEKALLQGFQEDMEEQSREDTRRRYYG